MRTTVTITFECEMQDVRDLTDNIQKNIKPMLDFYHTRAIVNLKPLEHLFKVEGAWNG